MSDRDLDAWRKAYRYGIGNDGAESPSDDELAALVTGELTGDERERVVMAMLKSPEAMEKHRILEELHQRATPQERTNRRWYQGVGVAAALVLAITTLVMLPTELPDGERGDVPAVSSPSGNVTLTEPPAAYRWTAEAGAHRYRVSVFDNAANRLWQSDWTASVQIAAPPADELLLSSAERYYWIVEIDGSSARRSLGPYWFQIE